MPTSTHSIGLNAPISEVVGRGYGVGLPDCAQKRREESLACTASVDRSGVQETVLRWDERLRDGELR